MKNNKDSNEGLEDQNWMNKLDELTPDKTIFYTIEKAIKQYKRYAQDQFDQKVGDITVDQALILHFVEQYPELSQSQIAALVFKDKASVTRIIELLKKNGYLKREINNKDRRKYSLKLTNKAKQILFKLKKIRNQNRTIALDGISAEQLSQLSATLNKLISNCEIE